MLLEVLDQREPLSFLVFFGAAIVLHDLVAFPLYTGLDRIAQRGLGARGGDPARVSALNHLRVPALLSGMFALVWLPLIFRLDDVYERATGTSDDVYLGRWLLLTGALFTASGLLYAVRLGRARRRAGVDDGRGPHAT